MPTNESVEMVEWQIRKMCEEIDDKQIGPTSDEEDFDEELAKEIRNARVLRSLKARGWVEAAAVFAEANPI